MVVNVLFQHHLNFIYFFTPKTPSVLVKFLNLKKVSSKGFFLFFSFLSFDTFSSQTLSEIISPFQRDAERDILRVPGKYGIHNA